MVSSSAMTYQSGPGSTDSEAIQLARSWMMAIVLEQWPLSVLGTPRDTVGILSSVIEKKNRKNK